LILSLSLVSIGTPLAAQSGLPTHVGVGATSTGFTGAVNDLAYNDKANVYLHVWGHPAVWGAFLNANGQPIGAPFLISAQSGSDSMPRVAYSTGSADDVFFVAFTSEIAGQRLYARLVRYVPGAPANNQMTAVEPVSVHPTANRQITGGIAFDASKRQFFLTWEDHRQGPEVFGQVWQLTGTASSPAMAAATGVLNITASPTGQGTPNVAFDPQHNKYLVVYRGEHPTAGSVFGSWARVVAFDAGMNPSYSGVVALTTGVETLEQNVLYAPDVDQFLTFWTDWGVGTGRNVVGALVDHNGLASGKFPIMGTPSGEGAPDAAYNPGTHTILMSAMRDQTRYAQGVMLTGTATIIEYFQSTTVVPAGTLESLYPQVTAASGGRFGVSYVNGYQFGYVDVWQGQGGSGGPAPPPPPPPCAVEPLPGATSVALSGASQTRTISVTASTADCAWSATPSASWITIVANGSGAGPGTVTYAVSRNTSGQTRSGTVTIGGGRVTISQAASFTNAAVHDISGDRASDMMWHNVGNGHVAVWNLVGHTVTATYYLTNPAGAGVDTSWKVAGTGDLNGDGFADIIWRHSGGTVAAWYMQNGSIVLTRYLLLNRATATEVDANWQIRAVGDLDGDGRSDIVWQNAGGTLGAWFMAPDGINVERVASFNMGISDANWKIAGSGDLNVDGKADIIWQNDATGGVGAWLMDGNQVVGQSNLSIDKVADIGWKIRGVGDTNGDGYADILWQHSSGWLAVWYLNRFQVIGTRWLSLDRVTDLNWQVVGPG
jgi:hypothetical protein